MGKKAQIGKKVGLGFLETVIHVCVYVLVFFLFIRVATLGYDFSYQVFGDPVMSKYNTDTVEFTVLEGQSFEDVASALESADLIKYKYALQIRAKLEKLDDSISPGTYYLSQSMTADEILAALTTPSDAGTQQILGEDASGTITETEASEDSSDDGSDGSAGDGAGEASGEGDAASE